MRCYKHARTLERVSDGLPRLRPDRPPSAACRHSLTTTASTAAAAMSLADVTANLRAPVVTRVDDRGPTVKVHAAEWRKVMAGEPVEINPSVSE